MSRVERRKNRKKRLKKRILIGAVAAVAAVYGGGAAFFHTHFFPQTTVEGMNVSFKSVDSAKEYINKELESYKLTISEPDGVTEDITADEAGLTYSNIDSVSKIIEEQPYALWFLNMTQEHKNTNFLTTSVDSDKLTKTVDSLSCANPTELVKSTDASIEYSKKEKKFVIKNSTVGNELDKEHFIADAQADLLALTKNISLEDNSYYVQPEVTENDENLIKTRKTMNKYLKGTITYSDGGSKVKLSKSDLKDMITYSSDYKVSINKDKVKSFVKKKVSKTFNSISGDIPSGLTCWKVDVSGEVKKAIKNIKSGKNTTRKPVYSKEGFDRENYSIGNTYCDVNISDQHMWYVENGKVVLSSDIVTGCVATGHQSPTGFYRIAFKQRNHTMVKYNSFVHYWMPYDTTNGIGFHDADWRSEFGGSIYRTNGSHGCINMPDSKAAALYSMISEGTAVYVHY